MHLEILSETRKNLLSQFSFINQAGFYLAGGTALALQLGHRTSVDFDFYNPKSFNTEKLIADFQKIAKVDVFMVQEDTLGLIANDEIEVTFFKYNYPLIRQLEKLEPIAVASIEDIAAMKMIAIIQRGTKRDFIDIYYLLKKYRMEELLSLTQDKFPPATIPLCLKSLVYFEDADNDVKSENRINIFDEKFSWKQAKKSIEKTVFDFQKKITK